jgi:peptidoglycan/xylan/chitin deacetylase (PgdA/CDA1 family)
MRSTLFIVLIFNCLFVFPQIAEHKNFPPGQSSFDIPVLAYHRFGDNRYRSTNTSLEVFEQHLRYLKENQYTVLTFGEAMERWKNNTAFPAKTVIITIDDGYSSFYENGWPLLKKYGFAATIFIQTDLVGHKDFISWAQFAELQKAGIEIQNHSDLHDFFVNYSDAERVTKFRDDLIKSTALIEKNLGKKPEYYVYPYGEWTNDMVQVLKENGYSAALVQNSGLFCETSDPFEIPRFPLGGYFGTFEELKRKIGLKALRIVKTIPDSPFLSENPPEIRVEVMPGKINLKKAQFFVAGTKCENIKIIDDPINPAVILKASGKLTARRTLYTITAPSIDGKTWHWYSYQWIRPEVGE